MGAKPKSNAKLLNLPEAQQAQLAEWLLSGMPYHRAQAAVLKEFGVEVSMGAFTGFWNEVCAPEHLRRRAKAVKMADEVAEVAERQPGRFDAATVDALKQKAFEMAVSPHADPDEVRSVMMLVLKARDQDLDERKLELDKAKFQWNAAKAVLEHANELAVIKDDKGMDEDQKLHAVRERLFGVTPE